MPTETEPYRRRVGGEEAEQTPNLEALEAIITGYRGRLAPLSDAPPVAIYSPWWRRFLAWF